MFLASRPPAWCAWRPAQEGSRVFCTENHNYRMRNGQIAETWSEVSFHHLLAQLTGKV
jgi:predicted ester cyclase